MAISERPILLLLPPDFLDPEEGEGSFVCPDCTAVEGLLSIYPLLRRELDIGYVPFRRPRIAIIELIGEEHQSCPVLVLPQGASSQAPSQQTNGEKVFFVGQLAIAEALAEVHGIGKFH